MAFVSADSDQFFIESWKWKQPGDPVRRLELCRKLVFWMAGATMAKYPPCSITLELPLGPFPKPSLMMHAGVISEAMCSGTGLAPWFITTKDWRKSMGLKGNCKKEEVAAWAREYGWDGLGPVDHAEALGIAIAAKRKLDVSD